MTVKMPEAVAAPRSVEDVSEIVRWAARNHVPLALRGGGHSQGGQSLTDRGAILDTMHLHRVELPGRDLVRAQGGASWGKLLDALRGTGLLPRVLADIPNVTVGGTLSAGGWGTTSHRWGVQIGQVEQLEVVTGTGDRVRCSRTRNAHLFDAVRGGQGQFGVITEAWIRLRKAGGRIRQYELRYRDYDRFVSDFEQILDEGRLDRLRAEIRLREGEIVMSAGVEYDGEHDEAKALDGLGHDEIVGNCDTSRVARAGIYSPELFDRRYYYPWRDWLMPWETLRDMFVQPWLDRDRVPHWPNSWIGIYPIGTSEIDAPLFMRPNGERILGYSVLSALDDHKEATVVVEALREMTGTLVGLGGKSYLSGGVGYGRREWQEHYGDKFELGLSLKQEFDPEQVFGASGMPFGEGKALRTGRSRRPDRGG